MADTSQNCPICHSPIPDGHSVCPACTPLTTKELRDLGSDEQVVFTLGPLPEEEEMRLRQRWAEMIHDGKATSPADPAPVQTPIPSPPLYEEPEPPGEASMPSPQEDAPDNAIGPEEAAPAPSPDGFQTIVSLPPPEPLSPPAHSLSTRYAVKRPDPMPSAPSSALAPGVLEGLRIGRGQQALLRGEYHLRGPLVVEAGAALHLDQAVLIFGEEAGLHCGGVLHARSTRFLAPIGGQTQVVVTTRGNARLEGCVWQHLEQAEGVSSNKRGPSAPAVLLEGSARAHLRQSRFLQPLGFSPVLSVKGKAHLLLEACQVAEGQFLLEGNDEGHVEMRDCEFANPGNLICAKGESQVLLAECKLEKCGGPRSTPLMAMSSSHLLLEDCRFFNCTGNLGGVASAWSAATVTCQGSLFFICRAAFGGALAALGQGNLEVDNCSFEECLAERNGGALAVGRESTLTVRRSQFIKCQASQGAAVFCRGLGGVSNCGFQSCQAKDRGGAICGKDEFRPQVASDNCTFANCRPKPEHVYP